MIWNRGFCISRFSWITGITYLRILGISCSISLELAKNSLLKTPFEMKFFSTTFENTWFGTEVSTFPDFHGISKMMYSWIPPFEGSAGTRTSRNTDQQEPGSAGTGISRNTDQRFILLLLLLLLLLFLFFHFADFTPFVGMACFAAPSAFVTSCVRASRASGASASPLFYTNANEE